MMLSCITSEPLERKEATKEADVSSQHSATERKDRPSCKCREFAWCALLPAAAFNVSQREKRKVSGLCLSRWALASCALAV